MTGDWHDDDVLRDEDWRAPLNQEDRRTAADVPEDWLSDEATSPEDEAAYGASWDESAAWEESELNAEDGLFAAEHAEEESVAAESDGPFATRCSPTICSASTRAAVARLRAALRRLRRRTRRPKKRPQKMSPSPRFQSKARLQLCCHTPLRLWSAKPRAKV
jgi:hypothetical protein